MQQGHCRSITAQFCAVTSLESFPQTRCPVGPRECGIGRVVQTDMECWGPTKVLQEFAYRFEENMINYFKVKQNVKHLGCILWGLWSSRA